MLGLVWLRIALVFVVASCGTSSRSLAAPSSTPQLVTPTRAPDPTKPAFSQPPLDPPTMVSWAIDPSGDPSRPYLFELHYDGAAMGFRVLDASGTLVLQLPIAGSGIFGPDSCVATFNHGGSKRVAATWRSIDEATYRDVSARAATFRVEIDTIGRGTVTLPLQDSGCRRT